MKITSLTKQKRNSSRFSLFVDHQFIVGISSTTLAKYNLYEGKNVGEDFLNDVLIHELEDRFLRRCIALISRSSKTEFQVRRYLKDLKFKKKGDWFSEESNLDFESLFDNVVLQLKKLNLIDDMEYAKLFIRSRVSNKPRGKRILISELISKGVSKDIAEVVCDELVSDELGLLRDTFEKKFKEESFDINNQKQVNFLLRKGFSYDLIKEFYNNEFRE